MHVRTGSAEIGHAGFILVRKSTNEIRTFKLLSHTSNMVYIITHYIDIFYYNLYLLPLIMQIITIVIKSMTAMMLR